MTAQTLDVVCIGNALVDVLAKADDAFLTTHGIPTGSMTLIDEARALQLYDAMGTAVEVSRGSAGTPTPCLAPLGGRAHFLGTSPAAHPVPTRPPPTPPSRPTL